MPCTCLIIWYYMLDTDEISISCDYENEKKIITWLRKQNELLFMRYKEVMF